MTITFAQFPPSAYSEHIYTVFTIALVFLGAALIFSVADMIITMYQNDSARKAAKAAVDESLAKTPDSKSEYKRAAEMIHQDVKVKKHVKPLFVLAVISLVGAMLSTVGAVVVTGLAVTDARPVPSRADIIQESLSENYGISLDSTTAHTLGKKMVGEESSAYPYYVLRDVTILQDDGSERTANIAILWEAIDADSTETHVDADTESDMTQDLFKHYDNKVKVELYEVNGVDIEHLVPRNDEPATQPASTSKE